MSLGGEAGVVPGTRQVWRALGTGRVGGMEDEAAVAGGREHSSVALGLERRRGWFGD